MKVTKTLDEQLKERELLLEYKVQREELRNKSNALSRQISNYKCRIYQFEQKDADYTAQINYIKECLAEKVAQRQVLKDQIKELSKQILHLKSCFRYRDENDLDLLPRETTLCYQLFGKKYKDLTVEEKAQYNQAYYKQKTVEKRKQKRAEKLLDNVFVRK